MNIYKTAVTQFLDLVKLKGDIESKEAIFDITKTGINILTKTSNNVLALRGYLKGEYEDIGTIGIGDLGLLKNFINSFDNEELTLTKVKNKLILKSPIEKLEIHANLTNPEYIKISVAVDKFNTHIENSKGNEFTLTKAVISKIISYCNSIKASDIILSGEGKIITLQLSELDSKIKASFDIEEEVQSFQIKFQASYLTNLLPAIPEKAIVSAHTNKPMYIKVENDAYLIEYMLAPIELKGEK